jgi:hypothetical protein
MTGPMVISIGPIVWRACRMLHFFVRGIIVSIDGIGIYLKARAQQLSI